MVLSRVTATNYSVALSSIPIPSSSALVRRFGFIWDAERLKCNELMLQEENVML